MKRHIRSVVLLLSFILSVSACIEKDGYTPDLVQGYVPIYQSDTNPDTVTFTGARATVHPGKIVYHNDLIYQVELQQGLHLIRLGDSTNNEKIGFYEIYGCNQVSLLNNYLYVNSLNNLVVIDISEITNPKVVSFKTGFYDSYPFLEPPGRGYFECIEPARGIVIGWETKNLHSPKCNF